MIYGVCREHLFRAVAVRVVYKTNDYEETIQMIGGLPN